MLKRTLTGAVMALIAIPVCIYSSTMVFPVVLALLSLIGAWEMLRCVGTLSKTYVSIPLAASALVFPILAALVNERTLFLSVYSAVMFIIMVYLLSLPVFSSGECEISDISVSFVSVYYITTAFVSLVLLRYSENGVYYFLIPILAPMVSDIFAYICGRLFGRHKLIPKISPNKTVEGSVGGTLFCIAACTGYGAILHSSTDLSINMLPIWAFAVGGFVIAIVSQMGDLIASAIKRKYNVKDYGRIFPGHGGVMDRFDSVISTAPLFFIFTVIMNSIGA